MLPTYFRKATFKRGGETERDTERGTEKAKVRHSTPSRSTSEARVSGLLMTLLTLNVTIPKVSNFSLLDAFDRAPLQIDLHEAHLLAFHLRL